MVPQTGFFVAPQLLSSVTLSWWRYLSYRNQSTDLHRKSMGWFLHDMDLQHEKVKPGNSVLFKFYTSISYWVNILKKCIAITVWWQIQVILSNRTPCNSTGLLRSYKTQKNTQMLSRKTWWRFFMSTMTNIYYRKQREKTGHRKPVLCHILRSVRYKIVGFF